MIVVGVTGSFGTGKSTVAQLLARRGAHVLNADALAHEAMAPGTAVVRRLRRRFGAAVVGADGAIHRAALARAGFASRRAWQDLCRIIHPAVIARTRQALRTIRHRHPRAGQRAVPALSSAPGAVVVLDVPLLIESGMTALVDWVVVVTAPRRVQLARLRARGRWPGTEIRRRLRWQMPLAQKVQRADVVIDNGGSRRATAAQVQQLWVRVHKEIAHA